FRAYQENQSPMDQLEAAGSRLIAWRDFPTPWSARPFDREGQIDGLVSDLLALADLSARCQRSKDYLFEDLRPVRDTAGAIRRLEEVAERDYDTLEGLLIKLAGDLGRKRRKGSGPYAEDVKREDVVAAREKLIQALEEFKDGADADLATLLQQEMRELITRYDDLKRAGGELDFVDLLICVHHLISKNRQVRGYLQSKFSHIFVDEFQDTDPLQAKILLLLAADDPEETNGLDARPKPGKLFLVGDPKQSVYRFRRADVVLYQSLRETLRAKGVGVVQLRKSWRAVRPLQEFVNAAFAPEMTGNVAAGQSDYVPLEKHAEARTDQPSLIALPVPNPYNEYGTVTKAAVEQSLPDTIGAFVARLLDRSKNQWKVRDPEDPKQAWIPIQPRHICILFRRFVSWRFQGGRVDVTREYLRALETRDIPHLLVGARSFHQREEVETMRAALTAIEWPDDELSVFATLKGSLFAIPDSLLLQFRQKNRSLHPFRPLPQPLPSDFAPIIEALGSLAELHRQRNRRPIVETVNALLEVARAHAGFALRPAGNQVLANVYRIADLARSFELSGGISFRGFVEELNTQAEREESGEAPVLEAGAEGVRVMTVHGAKGLEFPVVILADITCHLASRDPDLYVDAQQGLCAMRLVGCTPWELLEHQDEERERDRAEGVRVAYVAATRARDLLVVPAVEDQGSWEGIFRAWGDGWLAPLHKALYPPSDQRRQPSPAPGVEFPGESTLLVQDDRLLESSIRPGLHRPQRGKHSVVWWDPQTLVALDVEGRSEGNFGLRQAEVLQEEGEASSEGLAAYEEWKTQCDRTIELGHRPEFEVFTPTEALEGPPGFETVIDVEMIPKPAGRPQGPRFGTLVHTVLRDVELGTHTDGTKVKPSGRVEIERLARLHARVLGSPEEEIEAAVDAVSAALAHPLLERAGRAERRHRELPIVLKTEGGRLLEGNLDLAFLEDGGWTVVDFKTDADLPARQQHYRYQLEWYVFALSRITQQPARGWLLGI
ncbi:MAG TPA: UvrD-helicase domain-containing protein, partial [Terriglobia bacterium]|nr:UvrD-helicase domain-containing protein [Terriglobia bacterium]